MAKNSSVYLQPVSSTPAASTGSAKDPTKIQITNAAHSPTITKIHYLASQLKITYVRIQLFQFIL